MKNPPQEDRLDLLPGLLLIWQHKFLIGGLSLGAAVLAFVLCQFVSPLYESHSTLLPSKSNSRDQQLQDFSFGFEVHSERLVQLLGSESIFDSLNTEFDLASHYGIDMDERTWWDKYIRKATAMIQFHKTRYSSVVISVKDEDPEMAADLANYIAEVINVVHAGILKENAQVALKAAERDYQVRMGQVSEINDSIQAVRASNVSAAEAILQDAILQGKKRIQTIRNELDGIRQEYQIFDFGEQVNVLNEELATARAVYLQEAGALAILEGAESVEDSTRISTRARMTGAQRRVEFFEKQLDGLSGINKRYLALVDQLEEEKDLLADNNSSLNELRKSYEPNIESMSLQMLEEDYNWDLAQIRELRRQYQRALANFLDPVPIAYVSSRARPSYTPIYPKPVLAAGIGGLAMLVLSVVVLSFKKRVQILKG